jgi:type III secretion protein J
VSGHRRALALGLVLAACGEVSVVQGVPEAEANRVVSVLDRAGVAARKEGDEAAGSGAATFHVTVGRDEVAQAVGVLGAHELPRREEPGFQETFGPRSLVQTAAEERARGAQAIAGELARTLEALDGVLDARVHLALPEVPDVALEDAGLPRPTASVFVKYSTTHPPYDEAQLRRLVAGAVPGLRPEDVTILGVSRVLPAQATEARLAWVGPLAVARGSAGSLRLALLGLLGSNVLLGAGLVWAMLRRRRDEPSLPPQA